MGKQFFRTFYLLHLCIKANINSANINSGCFQPVRHGMFVCLHQFTWRTYWKILKSKDFNFVFLSYAATIKSSKSCLLGLSCLLFVFQFKNNEIFSSFTPELNLENLRTLCSLWCSYKRKFLKRSLWNFKNSRPDLSLFRMMLKSIPFTTTSSNRKYPCCWWTWEKVDCSNTKWYAIHKRFITR